MVDYTSQDMMNEWKKFYEMLKKTTVTTEKAEDMLKAFSKVMTETVKQADKFNRAEEARENQLQRWAKAQYLLHAKDQSLQKQKNKDTQDQIRLQSRAKSLHNQEMSTRQDDYFRGVRMNKRMSQSNKSFEKSLDLVTGNLFSWFPLLGKGVNQFGRTVKGMADYNQNMKDYQDQLGRRMQESLKSKGTPDEGKANEAYRQAFEELKNYMSSPQGVLGKIEIRGKKVADMLEGAKQYFNKHKTGILFGVGAFVGLVAVLKKALEVSPMFQQMLKLLNFGIMMILRPIGDFFGFFMRPVLIALLRYFILPWFKVAYPFYRKWGDTLGKLFTGEIGIGEVADLAWESLNTGIGQLAAVIGIGGTTGLIYSLKQLKDFINAVRTGATPNASGTGGGSGGSSTTTSSTKTSQLPNQQTKTPALPKPTTIPSNLNQAPKASQSTLDRLKAKASADLQKLKDKAVNRGILNLKTPQAMQAWAKANKSTLMRLASVAGKVGKASPVLAVLHPILSTMGSLYKGIDPEGYQSTIGSVDPNSIEGMLLAASGLGGFGYGQDTLPEMFKTGQAGAHTSGKWNKNKDDTPQWQQDKLNAGQAAADQWAKISGVDIPMANGGIISEPVIGMGRSGRTYSFGEKGSETVITNGGTTGGITINIQNMSGSHNDLQNLRKVIMQVMQESNTARGRI